MDVTMPDGTVIQGVPDGITKSQLMAKYQKLSAPKTDAPYQTDSMRSAYQGVMENVAKPINTAVNSVTAPVMGAIASAESAPAQGVANAIDSTDAGQWIGDKLLGGKEAVQGVVDNVKDLETYNPDLQKDLSAFGQNAQLAGNIIAAKAPLEAGESAIRGGSPLEFLKNTASGGADVLPTVPKIANLSGDLSKAVDPVGMKAIEGINKAYSDAKDVVNSAESAVRKTPLPINDTSLLDNLNNTIAKLSDKVAPGSDEQAALSRLSDIRDEIVSRTSDTKSAILDANGKPFVKAPSSPITTNDLLDIQQSINAGLPDNKFLSSGNASKVGLKAQVKRLLDEAATSDPNFGGSLSNYNAAAQDISRRFTGNKALKPLWQPEDYISWKAKMNNPAAPGYNDATLSRANEFLKNLNTDKTGRITAAMKALPSDVASDVLEAAKAHANSANPSTGMAIAKGVAKMPFNPIGGAREVVSTLATKPKPNPINTFNEKLKYKDGGSVKRKNLTAEFLGRAAC